MTANPMAWKNIAAFLIFASVCPLGFAQVDRTAYLDATIEELIAESGLRAGSREQAGRDTVLLAPGKKYKLQFKATGRIRELSPDAKAALEAWAPMYSGLQEFLKEYTHEVEVAQNDTTLWLMWQRKLVVPFQVERGGGGDIEVYAILAGESQGKLLLLATAFESTSLV